MPIAGRNIILALDILQKMFPRVRQLKKRHIAKKMGTEKSFWKQKLPGRHPERKTF
jgi:hypothetical protein